MAKVHRCRKKLADGSVCGQVFPDSTTLFVHELDHRDASEIPTENPFFAASLDHAVGNKPFHLQLADHQLTVVQDGDNGRMYLREYELDENARVIHKMSPYLSFVTSESSQTLGCEHARLLVVDNGLVVRAGSGKVWRHALEPRTSYFAFFPAARLLRVERRRKGKVMGGGTKFTEMSIVFEVSGDLPDAILEIGGSLDREFTALSAALEDLVAQSSPLPWAWEQRGDGWEHLVPPAVSERSPARRYECASCRASFASIADRASHAEEAHGAAPSEPQGVSLDELRRRDHRFLTVGDPLMADPPYFPECDPSGEIVSLDGETAIASWASPYVEIRRRQVLPERDAEFAGIGSVRGDPASFALTDRRVTVVVHHPRGGGLITKKDPTGGRPLLGHVPLQSLYAVGAMRRHGDVLLGLRFLVDRSGYTWLLEAVSTVDHPDPPGLIRAVRGALLARWALEAIPARYQEALDALEFTSAAGAAFFGSPAAKGFDIPFCRAHGSGRVHFRNRKSFGDTSDIDGSAAELTPLL